jgi:hypothetical protein
VDGATVLLALRVRSSKELESYNVLYFTADVRNSFEKGRNKMVGTCKSIRGIHTQL